MKRIILLFSLLISGFSNYKAAANSPKNVSAVLSVNNLNDAGPGSLRQAIADANALPGDDTIHFSSSLAGTLFINSKLPTITNGLFIDGPGAAIISINGRDSFKIFEAYNASFAAQITISGLTVCHGSGNTGGGIMNNGFCKMTIQNCIICDNNSPFSGAGVGGGLANGPGAEMTIVNCNILRNEAYTFGGGIYNMGKLIAKNCTFAGNISYKGGAFFTIRTTGIATVTNSTFSSNFSTGGSGCGIYVDLLSDLTLSNCTITNNFATGVGKGGGLFVTGATTRLKSCLIAGNGAATGGPDVSGTIISQGYNLIGNVSGCQGISNGINGDLAGDSLQALDARLGPLGNYGGFTQTHSLLSGSPAIDAGDCNGLSLDQRGVIRPSNGQCDIGSFEFAPSIPFSFGNVTVFIGAKEPKDNGKRIDIRAELYVNDSLLASPEILYKQIAGHQNNNGIKLTLPINVIDYPTFPGSKIKLKILGRKAGSNEMNASLWFNIDSLAGNSRGYSRMLYSMDNKPWEWLYLSEGYLLQQTAGDSANSSTILTQPNYTSFGTWSISTDEIQQMGSRSSNAVKKEEIKTADWLLYPNPASDQIFLKTPDKIINDLEILFWDVTGRIVATKKISATNANNLSTSTTDLLAGDYYYSIIEKTKNSFLRKKSGKVKITR